MIGRLRTLLARLGLYRSKRVARWAAVRHLDANDKRKREVIAQNRHDVMVSLWEGRDRDAHPPGGRR